MFNDKLQPFEGKVLVNQSALEISCQSVLKEMSLRNFEPQRINNYGVGTFQIGTNYEQATNVHQGVALIAKYNKFDQSVEIGDLNNASDGWVTYDPTQCK